ncbi:MAG: hypothetical protein II852_15920 [Bacteroidales bacterium]|jgi:HEAT repeat protein|nr:hypothetical protein [Bacteroidales bacterium]
MKKALRFFVAAAVTFSTVVCGAGGLTPTVQAQGTTEMTEESLMKNIKTAQGQTITLLEYKTVFNNYAKVEINEKGLALQSNPVDKVLMKLKMRYKLPNVEAYLLSLLTSKTPQLKGKAIDYLEPSPTTTPKILTALNSETNLYVINAGIQSLQDEISNDANVAKFILSKAGHENLQIRLSVAQAICKKSNLGVPGVTDAIRMLMTDPENRVRSSILELIGNLGDETFIADLAKILNDVAQAYCHRSTLKSLFKLWYNTSGKSSPAAYNVTIEYLTQKPRTNQIPVPDAISYMYFAQALSSDYYVEKYNEWKSKNDFYSESQWIEIMTDLATDNNAAQQVRTSAIKEVAKIGTKENLETIKKAVEANPVASDYDQKELIKTIDDLLNK